MGVVRRSTARQFLREGWTSVRLVAPAICRSVRQAFVDEVKPYPGTLLRQLTSRDEPHTWSRDGHMTNPVVNPHLLARFPAFCTVEQQVMRTAPLLDVVQTLLDAPAAMLQSAYYESSRGTKTHLDFNPLDRDQPMLGVWIALEDIPEGAGRFYLYPRSHTLPDTPDLRRFAELAWSSYRSTFIELDLDRAEDEAQALSRLLVDTHDLHRVTPALREGEALFWDRRVLHGSHVPVPGGGTRNSLLFHFVEAALVAERGLQVH